MVLLKHLCSGFPRSITVLWVDAQNTWCSICFCFFLEVWISSCVPHTVAVMTKEMIPGTDDSFIVTVRRDGPKSAEKLVRKTYRLSSQADAQSQQMSTLKGETRSVNFVIVAPTSLFFSLCHAAPISSCLQTSLSLSLSYHPPPPTPRTPPLFLPPTVSIYLPIPLGVFPPPYNQCGF